MTKKIFFLHGWGGTIKSWDNNIPFFLERGYKCYALKMEGRELPEPPQSWNVKEFAEASFKRIINLLEPGERPILVGHSFGGRQVIYLASVYSQYFDKIILTNAAGIKTEKVVPNSLRVKIASKLKKIESKTGNNLVFHILKEINARLYGSKDFRNANPLMREILKRVVDTDLRSYLPSIKNKTLIIWGDLDSATPLEQGKIINKGIIDSHLLVFKNIGHCVHTEIAEKWNTTVFDFLEN